MPSQSTTLFISFALLSLFSKKSRNFEYNFNLTKIKNLKSFKIFNKKTQKCSVKKNFPSKRTLHDILEKQPANSAANGIEHRYSAFLYAHTRTRRLHQVTSI